jgi:DNA-binding beta-propeller fold protein YncE
MFLANWKKNPSTYSTLLGVIILLCSLAGSSAALAQGNAPYISDVRIFDTSFPLPNAAGLTFSPQANAFLLLADHSTAASGGASANLLMITHFEDLVGSANLSTMASPINMAYDSQAHQLLLLDTTTNELVEIQAGPTGPDPAAVTRFPAAPLSLQTPQGMAVDPVSGRLFILDSASSQIVRVEPGPLHSFDPAAALAEGRISRMDLGPLGLGQLRGLAFNPTNGHLYFLSPAGLKLYEVAETGQLVASRELANLDLALRDPRPC